MTGMVADMTPDAARMKAAAGAGYATATDLADWLVRTLKMPFREAHHVTGRIVAAAERAGVPLDELPLAAMQAIEPRITKAVFGVLSVERSVASRTSYGGTAPANVRREASEVAEEACEKVTCLRQAERRRRPASRLPHSICCMCRRFEECFVIRSGRPVVRARRD